MLRSRSRLNLIALNPISPNQNRRFLNRSPIRTLRIPTVPIPRHCRRHRYQNSTQNRVTRNRTRFPIQTPILGNLSRCRIRFVRSLQNLCSHCRRMATSRMNQTIHWLHLKNHRYPKIRTIRRCCHSSQMNRWNLKSHCCQMSRSSPTIRFLHWFPSFQMNQMNRYCHLIHWIRWTLTIHLSQTIRCCPMSHSTTQRNKPTHKWVRRPSW